MANLKAISANCPSCGAALPVAPGIPQVTCRYCQNVITVEMRRAPPEVRPFGTPGAIPSRTLYVDPKVLEASRKASRFVLGIILVTTLLPVVIGLGAAFGGGCIRSITSAVHPYPITCGYNDEIEVSGTWEGTGPILVEGQSNCKIHIKNSKLKATSFMSKAMSNLEITIEGSTIETTETMFRFQSSMKLHVINSVLTANTGAVVEADSSPVVDAIGSTFESKTASAFKTGYGLKLQSTSSKFRGKKSAFESASGLEITMKAGTEITGADGPAIKADSSLKLTSEGASKISSAESSAIVSKSNTTISGSALTISSPKDKAIEATSTLKVDLTDSSITASSAEAIEVDSGCELVLSNTTIQGTVGLDSKSGLKIKATKKSRIVGTTGNGVLTTSGPDISLTDSSIEGGAYGVNTSSTAKFKLAAGSRIAGKRGGIYADSGLTIDGTHTSIEGGAGPGIRSTFIGAISIHDSVVKGTPGIQIERAPTPMDLANTRVDGGQVITRP